MNKKEMLELELEMLEGYYQIRKDIRFYSDVILSNIFVVGSYLSTEVSLIMILLSMVWLIKAILDAEIFKRW